MIDFKDEVYVQDRVAFFRKSKERFGGLGNMAGGYPLIVNNTIYSSSEALYHCARYPHLPKVQEDIRLAHNGFAAKLVAKQYYDQTREDWEDIRVVVMLHTLTLKVQDNYDKIVKIIEETGDREIVEWSRKNSFWGAQPDHDLLVGKNILGKLWMYLRPDILDGSIRYHYPDLTLFPGADEGLVAFYSEEA